MQYCDIPLGHSISTEWIIEENLHEISAKTMNYSISGHAFPNGEDSDQTLSGRKRFSEIRPPRAEDATAIWSLVEKSRSLDSNSPYAYLLLCTDFAGTGAVAEADGEVVGFALGYRPPTRPESCFVWQVAVAESHRGLRLASELIDHLLARTLSAGVTFLEATVTPSNAASRALFRGVARRAGVACCDEAVFASDLFPDGGHEEEVRIRIGPLKPESLHAQHC